MPDDSTQTPNCNKALRLLSTHEGVKCFKHVAWVKSGKSVWYGLNSYKSHPDIQMIKQRAIVSTTHAEVAALRATPEHLRKGADLFVMRTNEQGALRMSKPCATCQEVIKAAGVRRVHYSTVTGWQTWNVEGE